ncbi:MAG: cytochrome c biogenesis protein CcdA [Desulfobacterales bacterium]
MFAESVSYSASFLAGLFSFLSPCILPLIPAYFTFITGFSLEDLTANENHQIRKKVIISTTAYVAGFSTIFILLGASASLLGSFIQDYSDIVRITGGILIILLGIHLTGIIHFGTLDVEKRIHPRKKPLHFFGTFLVGMAFAAGWSPCIGPQLGSILIIAGNQDTVAKGVVLLSFYSAGLAIPFMIISVFIHLVLDMVKKAKRILKYVNIAAGVFLIIVGLVLIADKLYLFTQLG